MSIRIFNNTKVETDFLLDLNKHLIYTQLDTGLIESITFEENHMVVFGIECILAEIPYTKDVRVKGSIRWFDKSSGKGSIRLTNDQSVMFYACNVDGADSLYPELVSNIDFESGDSVEATVSCDSYTFKALGLTHVKKGA